MKNKIPITPGANLATILATLFLIILPFLVGTWISNYTPYLEGNSFQSYVIIWIVTSIVTVAIALPSFKYFHQSFEKIPVGGILLFLLACPIIGIYGLASAPDLSLKMLEHPEREHFRYSLLFIAEILFAGFILFLFRSELLTIKKSIRWIMTVIFIMVFAEFTWEFTHHYLYPEGLREWLGQGKNADEFGKNYDNFNAITFGSIGRYFQFISIIWLSLYLYKLRQIKIWSPIILILISLLGIVSATLILVTKMNLPKGFEFLFLFFIPGIPFILLYWLGVALVTKFKKSEIQPEKDHAPRAFYSKL
ncbi:hypothetical protein FHS68_003731 [Dyadobacter arcticus]|uniref:Uncharacterized protein n=2 Tax=Dyadobacter arcticus TaxID=1078754 RepID=A0ABX0URK2_9BACT|nr:hypothetical protein [Dyadobacter arcticus]